MGLNSLPCHYLRADMWRWVDKCCSMGQPCCSGWFSFSFFCWGRSALTTFVICFMAVLSCPSILVLASSTSVFMSAINSVNWLLSASLTISLIANSSISSSKKAMACIMFMVCFSTPDRAEIWCRQMAGAVLVTGLPGGHKSGCSSKDFLPSLVPVTPLALRHCWLFF